MSALLSRRFSRAMLARTSRAMLATGLLVATTAVPATADISGQVFGLADADLLQVEAVSLPPGCGDESLAILGQALACDFGLAQLVVGDTEARADSGATLEYDGDTGLSSYGHGSNLDVDLLTVGGSVGTLSEELLVRSDARQASGETSDADELLSLPDNPVLGLDLATTEASAIDVGAGNTACPEIVDGRATISHGRSELLGLRVAPNGLGDGQDLAATSNPEDISYAESRIELVDALVGGADDGTYGVEATATVLLAPVTLFGGAVEVAITQPKLVARHDGQAMTTDYTTPIVTINGSTVLDGDSIEVLDMLDVPLAPVLTLEVGIANAEDIVVDGDVASLSGVVTLDLVIGGVIGVASISLGDLSAGATAPAGGATIDGCILIPRAPDPDPIPLPAPDPDPVPEPTPDLPNTGGGAALAALVALGGAFALRRRRD